MLSLIFKETTLTSASIPVRWCLSPEALEEVEASGRKAFILIKLTYGQGYKPKRYLFPLDQFSAYLDVHRAGPISFQAVVVTVESDNKSILHYGFVADTCDREEAYPHTLFNFEIDHKNYKAKTYDQSESYDFVMPKNLFGAEIPEWTKFYVNRYWYSERNKCQDECEQRRRVMLFFVTTFLILLFEFLGRFLYNLVSTAFAYSILAPVGFTYIRHPFTKFNLEKTPCLIETLIEKRNQKYFSGLGLFVLVAPFIPFIALVFMALISLMSDYPIHIGILVYLGGYYSAALVVYMLIKLGIVLKRWFNALDKFLSNNVSNVIENMIGCVVGGIGALATGFLFVCTAPFMWLLNRIEPEAEYHKVERTRALLTCPEKDGQCLPPISVRDKSARLIFADIKNKVCKPMQG